MLNTFLPTICLQAKQILMIDPVTALAVATTAFNAIKKGIQFGRDLESMANDLSHWGRASADFEFAEKQIKTLLDTQCQEMVLKHKPWLYWLSAKSWKPNARK